MQTAYGVEGSIYVPTSAELDNYGDNEVSAADMTLLNGNDFVQLGWYIGGADIPTVYTPHVFFGEADPGSPSGEDLTKGTGLAFGSQHYFEVILVTGGHYNFYVDGAYVGSTSLSHFPHHGTPAFFGETSTTCTAMAGKAHNDSGFPTLEFIAGSDDWTYFDDSRALNRCARSLGGYYSTGYGYEATDHAYGVAARAGCDN